MRERDNLDRIHKHTSNWISYFHTPPDSLNKKRSTKEDRGRSGMKTIESNNGSSGPWTSAFRRLAVRARPTSARSSSTWTWVSTRKRSRFPSSSSGRKISSVSSKRVRDLQSNRKGPTGGADSADPRIGNFQTSSSPSTRKEIYYRYKSKTKNENIEKLRRNTYWQTKKMLIVQINKEINT